MMRRGEVALIEREEEVRLLNVQLNDFVRKMDILHKKIPELRKFDAEIQELKWQIDREQKEVDELTVKLEVPNQKDRRRRYCGRNFSEKELDEKVAMYENQLSSKNAQSYEQLVLLRAVDEKIAHLKGQIDHDFGPVAKVLEKTGALRSEQIAARRKKMAALSEMAVYQAQQEDLMEQKQGVVQQMEDAAARSARGQAFDEQADKLLRMHERDLVMASPAVPEYEDEEDEDARPGRQKYDAYPTADGLSRPYGAFPVFQPGAPAANLRFFKKEGVRPVVM
jgi:hypothetical protein